MKISELPRLSVPSNGIEFPVASEGENYNVTLGQIIYAVPSGTVRFVVVRNRPENVVIEEGTPQTYLGSVIYDTQNDRFYLAKSTTSNVAGQNVTTWSYYKMWNTYSSFHTSDGKIRQDCIFCDGVGRLYFSLNGQNLRSAGITEEQAKQIRHATPIEVESEAEMQQRIEAGEYEEGQLYFLAEG